jgi:glycosyltransferase involved in cell wall biosynthesis
MAAGLPVVASAVGGLLDLIDHRRTGLLVPPADPEALAGALRRLIDDPARASSIGKAARADVHQRYSFDRMIGSFEDLYVSGLQRHVSPGTHHAEAAGI